MASVIGSSRKKNARTATVSGSITPMIALRTAPTSWRPTSIATNAAAENTIIPSSRHQSLAGGNTTALNATL